MRMNILSVGLVCLLATGLASCGGESGQPLTAGNANGVLTQLNTVLRQLPRTDSLPALPTGLSAGTASVGSAALACEKIEPNVREDVDQDGIAKTKKVTFDCSNEVSGGTSYTRKGDYEVTDLDDTVKGILGGMHVVFNLSSFGSKETDGSVGDGSHLGFWKYKGNGSGGMTSTSDYAGRYYYKGSQANYEYDYKFAYTWDFTMTPDSSAQPWVSGKHNFTGTYSMDGKFMQEGAGNTSVQVKGTWLLKFTSKDLKYKASCSPFYYESGSVMIDDSSGGTIEIRYACATAKLYVNGVESDWWTPQN